MSQPPLDPPAARQGHRCAPPATWAMWATWDCQVCGSVWITRSESVRPSWVRANSRQRRQHFRRVSEVRSRATMKNLTEGAES